VNGREIREMTCIVCPNGCRLTAQIGENGEILSIDGALCKRGEAYARQEIISPMRTISSSVRVMGGELPLASVRLNRPVPKKDIFRVMDEIRGVSLLAPVKAGTVVIADVLGLGSDVIATKDVD